MKKTKKKKTATESLMVEKERMKISDWEKGAREHMHKDFVSYITNDIAQLKVLQMNFEMMYGVKLVIEVAPLQAKSKFDKPDEMIVIHDVINNFFK